MFVSTIMEKLGIQFEAINERNVKSLGLVSYNEGFDVCTFVEKEYFLNDVPTSVSMIIARSAVAEVLRGKTTNYGLIVTENPRVAFFQLHNFLSKTIEYKRALFDTIIGEDSKISKLSYIAEKNVIIGKNVKIEEFVSIKENTIIGDNSVIRAGSIIGGTGYEFKKSSDGFRSFLVEHIGGVRIGNNVEIQHNSCIDRAIYPWDDTVIDDYSSIDNLVYIAHGVKMGKLTFVASGATIGGRCCIGSNVWIGLGAIIRNGIELGDNCRANMGAVVTKSIPKNTAVSGNFAMEHRNFIAEMKRKQAILK